MGNMCQVSVQIVLGGILKFTISFRKVVLWMPPSYFQCRFLCRRKTAVINLDPANDSLPYDCTVDIEELIKLDDVMTQYGLGPNGGLVYCMDYLEKNIDWLEKRLEPLAKGGMPCSLLSWLRRTVQVGV